MEQIDPVYAAVLHQQVLHPYSQYLICRENQITWYVNALNDEAYEKIILPLLSPDFTSFTFSNGVSVTITEKKQKTQTDQERMDLFTGTETTGRFEIHFLSPTAFKQNGRYFLLPEPRLIFQSLMNRYSAVDELSSMTDEDTLEQLTMSSVIRRYQLRTVSFPLEGTAVPGFIGSISLQIKGNQTMARYVRLLLQFGEFSGIGIKTGMGMGGIQFREGAGKKHE